MADGIPPEHPQNPDTPSGGDRTYWLYFNRPYPGCGFLYILLLVLLVFWVLAVTLFPALAFWNE